MKLLNLGLLRQAVREAAAIRFAVELEPAAGSGEKVFPASYAPAEKRPLDRPYAYERRLRRDADGQPVVGENGPLYAVDVVIDSVAAQANQAEAALDELRADGLVSFPAPYVDFADTEVAEFGRISVLDAPHRLADATFRNSRIQLNGSETAFPRTELWETLLSSSVRNAAPLFRYAPTCLLFGMWDSTGPKGGRGQKFPRRYTGEIVAQDVDFGEATSSRVDPLGIEAVVPIYESADPEEQWTANPDKARKDGKGQLVLKKGAKDTGKAGNPSNINLGNITPSVVRTDGGAQKGGVSAQHIRQTIVLSLAGLRQLRFGTAEQNLAARTALAALGVAAAAGQADYDLRSRCQLVPTSRKVEVIGIDGLREEVSVNRMEAAGLVTEAAAALPEAGLAWEPDLRLRPSDDLVDLVVRSQSAAVTQ